MYEIEDEVDLLQEDVILLLDVVILHHQEDVKILHQEEVDHLRMIIGIRWILYFLPKFSLE